MILEAEDAIEPFNRTDPDCDAYWDLMELFPTICCDIKTIHRFLSRLLCCEVINIKITHHENQCT